MGWLPLDRYDLRCPHCGRIDWSRIPQLRQTLWWITRQKRPVTSHEVAEAMHVTLDVASHRVSVLARARLLHVALITHKARPDKNGKWHGRGRLRLFTSAVEPSEFAVRRSQR
jgi:hypothetical protein